MVFRLSRRLTMIQDRDSMRIVCYGQTLCQPDVGIEPNLLEIGIIPEFDLSCNVTSDN